MTEATCRRELDLEIPAEEVQKAVERVARGICARGARAGISPGQSARDADPAALCRRHQGRSAAIAGARADRKGREGPET